MMAAKRGDFMKKHAGILLLVLFVLCGSSCQSSNYLLDTRFDTEEYLKDFDMPMEYAQSNGLLARSGNVYYAGLGNLAVYHDLASGTTGALCAKADCTHNSMSCNAFLDLGGPAGIQVYDGQLYWLQLSPTGWAVYRMGLDGNNREQVQNIQDPESYDLRFAIHRGYLYTAVVKSGVEGGESKRRLEIKQYVLGKQEEEPYTIYAQEYSGTLSYLYRICGNRLYVAVDNDPEWEGSYDREFFVFHIATREWKLLWSDTQPWLTKDIFVDQTGADILEVQNKDSYAIQKACLDFETGVREEKGSIAPIVGGSSEKIENVAMTENYIVLYTSAQLASQPNGQSTYVCRILDRDTYETVSEHETSGEYVVFVGGDENGVFLNQEVWAAEQLSETEELSAYKILMVPYAQDEEASYLMEYDETLIIGRADWKAVFP